MTIIAAGFLYTLRKTGVGTLGTDCPLSRRLPRHRFRHPSSPTRTGNRPQSIDPRVAGTTRFPGREATRGPSSRRRSRSHEDVRKWARHPPVGPPLGDHGPGLCHAMRGLKPLVAPQRRSSLLRLASGRRRLDYRSWSLRPGDGTCRPISRNTRRLLVGLPRVEGKPSPQEDGADNHGSRTIPRPGFEPGTPR